MAANRRTWLWRSPGWSAASCEVVRQVKIAFADPRVTLYQGLSAYALELLRDMTIQDVADHLGISWDVIKEIQKADLEPRYDRPE